LQLVDAAVFAVPTAASDDPGIAVSRTVGVRPNGDRSRTTIARRRRPRASVVVKDLAKMVDNPGIASRRNGDHDSGHPCLLHPLRVFPTVNDIVLTAAV